MGRGRSQGRGAADAPNGSAADAALPPDVSSRIAAAEKRRNWASTLGKGIAMESYGFDDKNNNDEPPSFGLWDLVKRKQLKDKKWMTGQRDRGEAAITQTSKETVLLTSQDMRRSATSSTMSRTATSSTITMSAEHEDEASTQRGTESKAATAVALTCTSPTDVHDTCKPDNVDVALQQFLFQQIVIDGRFWSGMPNNLRILRCRCLADQICRIAQDQHSALISATRATSWDAYLRTPRGRDRMQVWASTQFEKHLAKHKA